MRFFLLFFTLVAIVVAQNVEVTAEKFSASELVGRSEFTGNVVVKKGEDILKSDKLTILFDKKRKPTKYEAFGNASIDMTIDTKSYYVKGDKLIYEPNSKLYKVEGNAFLHDKTTNKKVYGDFIKVDQSKGIYEVDGHANKPVKFVFQVEDEK